MRTIRLSTDPTRKPTMIDVALMNDHVREPYERDDKAYDAYKQAFTLINALDGDFDMVYDDPDEPYVVHAITIQWNEDCGEIPGIDMSNICRLVDVIDVVKGSSDITFITTIYRSI